MTDEQQGRTLGWRAMATGAAIVLLLGACTSDDGDDELPDGVEESVDAEPALDLAENPCSLTTSTEVGEVFGAPARSEVDGQTCRYDLTGLGVVKFRLHYDDTRPLLTIAPDGASVDEGETESLWVPGDEGGGVLFRRAEDHIVEIDVEADLGSDTAAERSSTLAAAIVERLAEQPARPADAEEADPCALVSTEIQQLVLGESVKATADSPTTCLLDAEGTTVLFTVERPATVGMLAGLQRSSTIDGAEAPWERTEVSDVGEGAARIDSPDSSQVELWAVADSALARVTAFGGTPERSAELAQVIAAAALG